MNSLLNITWRGMFYGIIGTSLGGVAGTIIGLKSDKIISFILEFASGLMISIICFDLIPEAIKISNLEIVLVGLILGLIFMIICDEFIKNKVKNNSSNDLLKIGIIIGIGLAIHNFPEGLAIGAGFEVSQKLGIFLGIAIAIHDFPEGVSISVPLLKGGVSKGKTIFLTTLSGITTGIGAFCGVIIGNISTCLIAISLSFAAGTMLYIVSCELIPEASKLYKGRVASFGNIFGILVGMIAKVIV